MNKKIIYSLIFTSIFLLSTISVFIQPAAGASWTYGVPDAAKGMETESEIKVYDKDEWGYHLGYAADDTVNYKYGGDGTDANDVGSKSKSEIDDWGRADIWYFGDNLMTSDITPNYDGSPTVLLGTTLTDYWSAVTTVEPYLASKGEQHATASRSYLDWGGAGASYLDPALQPGALAAVESLVAVTLSHTAKNVSYIVTPGQANNTLWMNAQAITDAFAESIYSRAEVTGYFDKTYKGTILERDKWDYVKEGDYKSKPDEKEDEVPFIEDPHSIYDSYEMFGVFLESVFDQVDGMIDALIAFNTTFQAMFAGGAGPFTISWGMLNKTMGDLLSTLATPAGWAAVQPLGLHANTIDTFIDYVLGCWWDPAKKSYVGTHPLQAGEAGLLKLKPYFIDAAPTQKFEYLSMVIDAGLPAHQPVDKWWDTVIDDFDINEDQILGDNSIVYPDIELQYMTTYHGAPSQEVLTGVQMTDDAYKGDISIDDKVISVDIEWELGVLTNQLDATSQRDDYEIEYTVSDTGGISKIEYKGSDTFFMLESLAPVIPGYEISILLGAAAISAIALIYVVMKKKRM